jgi:SAM-dependent methyltransferase
MAAISGNVRFSSANAIKADFGDIYRAKDPRGYFGVLGGLGYVIPEIAGPALLQLADCLIRSKGRPITILDIGCSYGILSAVMRYGLSIDELRNRYAKLPLQALSSDGLACCDAHYFASWAPREDLRFVGLDRSSEAIAYAQRVGLIEEGLIVDLETNSPSERARSVISTVDFIVSTGAVGYISENTFARLLQAFPPGKAPWIASFVLRMFDYGSIAETARHHGLATERLEGVTFMQRRFRDEMEAEETLRLLEARGVDPAGKETGGAYHAELFVSRPPADVKRAGLSEIVSSTSQWMKSNGEGQPN